MPTRRDFLRAASLVSMAPMIPDIFARGAETAGAASDEKVLVVIQLDGGNDGLNTVVPYDDDEYGRNRNELRLVVDQLHKLDAHVGLHPGMRAAKELYDDGQLAIVQGVGYPNPDRSHFRSMRIWHTARLQGDENSYGWLGRACDCKLSPAADPADASMIYVGDRESPIALWGRRSAVLSLSQPGDLNLAMEMKLGKPPRAPATPESLDQFVTRQVLTAYHAADDLRIAQRKESTKNGYPDTELASHLETVSQLLKSGSRSRVFYTVQPGFDTHSEQLSTHYRLLQEFSDSVKAFLDDLRAARLHERVLLLAFSEFGRRVRENDSKGTDHGTAGPVFLAGGSVRGGLIGSPPDLRNLEDGDLAMQFDFRQIYAEILDRWLGISSREVLGASFPASPALAF